MQHATLLDKVRELVSQTFVAHDLADASDYCETLLVREGFYCGRCFTCDTMRAVWFAEEDVVKFYGADGEFLKAESLTATSDLTADGRQAA